MSRLVHSFGEPAGAGEPTGEVAELQRVSAEPAADPLEAHRQVPVVPVIGLLVAGLALACVAAASMGAYSVAPGEVLSAIGRRVGILAGAAPDTMADRVLWEIRFPRVALAVVVGAALACAGAVMQGTFANPLAEPGVVGVSSGAVLGAVAQIVIGFTLFGSWSVTVAAFAGGLATLVVVYMASRSDGRTEVVTLVLTGIAVNALVGAVIGLLTYVSTDAELRSITFWTLGSVAQATWPKVAAVAPVALAGVLVATACARRLDLLALGEPQARHLGVDVERFRATMLVVVAMLTAAAVAVSGIILFVGLVVPHLIRMVLGPAHRVLLPASALAGALVLVVADLVARTAVAPAELPLGVLTALVGSPFFLWQLRRTRARQGGWA
ncbi:MAG: iron ABC transporter permease [Microthrixaceae bacterium]|nr:iron ABC transporter permease [Microthrixaceae bacterium]